MASKHQPNTRCSNPSWNKALFIKLLGVFEAVVFGHWPFVAQHFRLQDFVRSKKDYVQHFLFVPFFSGDCRQTSVSLMKAIGERERERKILKYQWPTKRNLTKSSLTVKVFSHRWVRYFHIFLQLLLQLQL